VASLSPSFVFHDFNRGEIPGDMDISSPAQLHKQFRDGLRTIPVLKYQESFVMRMLVVARFTSRFCISLDALEELHLWAMREQIIYGKDDDWSKEIEIEKCKQALQFIVTLTPHGHKIYIRVKVKVLKLPNDTGISRLSRAFPEHLVHVKLAMAFPHPCHRMSYHLSSHSSFASVSDSSSPNAEWFDCMSQAAANAFVHSVQAVVSGDAFIVNDIMQSFPLEAVHSKGLQNLCKNGFTLCGRIFEPVACSLSQACSFRAWFFGHEGTSKKLDDVLNWSFDYDSLCILKANPCKFLLRMGILNSPSIPTLSHPNVELNDLSDEEATFATEDNKAVLVTDGCGMIPFCLAKAAFLKFLQSINGHESTFFSYGSSQATFLKSKSTKIPSALQVRYAGYKGMLVVVNDAKNDSITFRKSMRKFGTPLCNDHLALEIMSFSCPSPFVTLNFDIVAIFVHQQRNDAPSIRDYLRKLLLEYCTRFIHEDDELYKVQLDQGDEIGFNLRQFGLPRRIWALGLVNQIAISFKFPLPQSGKYFGVSDPTNTVIEGQIFIFPSDANDPLSGKLFLLKEPCLQWKDMIEVEGISINIPQALLNLRDVIVFSSKARIPDQFRMAGSDLDGDQFIVIWNKDILSCCKPAPLADSIFRAYQAPADQERFEIHEIENITAEGGARIFSLLSNEILPFHAIIDVRKSYVLKFLDSAVEYNYNDDPINSLGILAAKAVDSFKTNHYVRLNELSNKEKRLFSCEPKSYMFDPHLPTRVIEFQSRGWISSLTHEAICMLLQEKDVSFGHLSILDEHRFVRLWSLQGIDDVEDGVRLPNLSSNMFRNLALFNLLWEELIISNRTWTTCMIVHLHVASIDLYEEEKLKLSRCGGTLVFVTCKRPDGLESGTISKQFTYWIIGKAVQENFSVFLRELLDLKLARRATRGIVGTTSTSCPSAPREIPPRPLPQHHDTYAKLMDSIELLQNPSYWNNWTLSTDLKDFLHEYTNQ
jgi:hypothetical protein